MTKSGLWQGELKTHRSRGGPWEWRCSRGEGSGVRTSMLIDCEVSTFGKARMSPFFFFNSKLLLNTMISAPPPYWIYSCWVTTGFPAAKSNIHFQSWSWSLVVSITAGHAHELRASSSLSSETYSFFISPLPGFSLVIITVFSFSVFGS